MEKETFIKLIDTYLLGTASAADRRLLEIYYQKLESKGQTPMNSAQEKALEKLMLGNIQQEISESQRSTTKVFKLWQRIAVAAAVLLIIGAVLFYYNSNTTTATDFTIAKNDIQAGSNKAYLTLANGKRLSLTDARNGTLAKEAGVKITKTTDGQLIYSISNNAQNKTDLVNAIETPKGGQYQVLLPDGSRVWLNSASKLTYPVSFSGSKQRRVTLNGEAYFEIAKVAVANDRHVPFIVTSKGQEVEVLGTHFNINGYAGEVTTTTLLEGAVIVRHPDGIPGSRAPAHAVRLLPGQQSTLQEQGLSVGAADMEGAIAWKNGYFKFNENLESMMKKIARWYDVEVVYEAKQDPELAFGAKISRTRTLFEVLKIVESTGKVHFKVEGRRVTVMN